MMGEEGPRAMRRTRRTEEGASVVGVTSVGKELTWMDRLGAMSLI